jgi:phage I-like protein
VKSFKALVGNSELNYEPPLKLGHDDDQAIIQESGFPSIGWVQALRVKGDKLVADFKGVPKKLADIIKAGGYKKVSSELYFDYSIGGKTWPAVLKAVALLGADVPAVKTIADIRAAYDENAIPEVVVYMAEKQVLSLDGLMTELDRVIEEAEPAIKTKVGAPAIRTYLREVKAKLRALLAKAQTAENSDVSESLDQKARLVRDAWWAQLQGGLSGAVNEGAGWVRDVFADSVVVEKAGGFEQVPYAVSEDGVVAFAMDKAVKVTIRYVPVDTEESNAGTPANTNDEETQMREAIAKVLGFPADATEDQVLKGIEALKSTDKLSENEGLKARLAAAETQLQDKHIGEIVDRLVADGRLLPAQVEAARAALRSDEKAFTALMEAQPKVVELGERGSGADSANPAGAELSESDRKVAEALGIKLEEFATARASEKGAK